MKKSIKTSEVISILKNNQAEIVLFEKPTPGELAQFAKGCDQVIIIKEKKWALSK